ncbi:hypothetical protein [Thiohalocapsa marina]|uniref:hypothetical protein n=1 Tax=Thiohalocapsa marina TaxID=424902 RepID=UPI0036D7A2A6
MLHNSVVGAGAKPPPPVGHAIPIITNTASLSYLCLVSTTGTYIKAISLGAKLNSVNISYQRYGQFMNLFVSNNTIYRVNLQTGAVTSRIDLPSAFTFWARISPTQALNIETQNNAYNVYDLTTGTNTRTTGYTASTASPGAGSNGLVTFYTRGDTTISNFQERVFWGSTFSTSTFTAETNSALFQSGVLTARTTTNSGHPNQSRQSAMTGNTNTAAIVHFDSQLFKVDRASGSVARWYQSNDDMSHNGQAYTLASVSSPRSAHLLTSNLLMYRGMFSFAVSQYKWIVATTDFSQASSTQGLTYLFSMPATSYHMVAATMVQIDAAGTAAFLYLDTPTNNNTLKLVIASGTAITNTYTVTLPTSVSTKNSEVVSLATSEITP